MQNMHCYCYCDDAVIVTDVLSLRAANEKAECSRLARLRNSDVSRLQQLERAAKAAQEKEAAASKRADELQARLSSNECRWRDEYTTLRAAYESLQERLALLSQSAQSDIPET